jgi:hypothetical protein
LILGQVINIMLGQVINIILRHVINIMCVILDPRTGNYHNTRTGNNKQTEHYMGLLRIFFSLKTPYTSCPYYHIFFLQRNQDNTFFLILYYTLIVGGNRRTRRKPLTCRNSLGGVEPTTSVVIGTDCIGSCKSNYHTITPTAASPYIKRRKTNNLM